MADRSIIRAVKEIVQIPVIGNGDILCAKDAIEMMRETGCDGVMIGRAAIGNPWIFSQTLELMRNGQPPEPDLRARFEVMETYLTSSVRYFGELHACRMMRSRLCWFVKGLRFSSNFRESIKQVSTESEALFLIREYLGSLIS
jgi:tRNA-dihydrouridine synthase